MGNQKPSAEQPLSETIYYTRTESPLGTLLLTSDGASLTGLYMSEYRYGPTGSTQVDGWGIDIESRSGKSLVENELAAPFAEAKSQLEQYFEGTLTSFRLPLQIEGTDFQRMVWAALLEIPYGTTTSYGDLARRVGNPNGSRAVGLANGHNPISIIVPCHRVIGSNGKLTGYGGGLPRKAAVLDFEFAVRLNGPYPFPSVAGW